MGRLDFNFWYDAQDTDDGMPGTGEDHRRGGCRRTRRTRKVVDVTFTNFSPHENRFYFEKSAAGWKLDDVTSVSEGWALSLILRYPVSDKPFLNRMEISMRYGVAAAAAFFLMLSPASAAPTRIDDPVKFVTATYAATVGKKPEPDDIYTPRLDALFKLMQKDAGDEVGRLDFDFWMNGQDGTVSGVTVSKVDGRQREGPH